MNNSTSYLMRVVVMLLITVSTTVAWAQNSIDFLTQDANDGSYIISSQTDWDNLADFVKDGNDCAGLSFKLMDDISVSTTLGYQVGTTASTRLRFAGIFNGNNHTLNVNLNSADADYNPNYCAPFAYVDNFSLSNIHITGSITTTGQFAGGAVGSATGLCTLQNVHVSVAITTNRTSGNGNHGGIVGIAENGSSFTNCWFDGKLLGNNFKYSGGFVGINKVSATLNNCLFNPEEISLANTNSDSGACTFIHPEKTSDKLYLTDVYYTSLFGEKQGVEVLTDEPDEGFYESVVCADNNTYYVITGNPLWIQLQADLNNEEISEINLTQDIIAASADEALVVPSGRDVTINLNGFSINRNQTTSGFETDGNVITVSTNSFLTINGDESDGGSIIGGKNIANGGGIVNNGVLTLVYVTISDNASDIAGGGIYNGPNATLNIYDSYITNNKSNITGGGLYLQGSCHLERNEIKQNTVLVNNNGYGGGCYIVDGDVYMTDCLINANKSQNQGGGIFINGGQATIENSNITNNTAYAQNVGGGIYIMGGELSFHNGEITGNMGNKGNKNTMKGAGVIINGGTFNISGLLDITGNHFHNDVNAENNVYVIQGNIINIDGELDASSYIGITMGQPGVFTQGLDELNGNGYSSSFFSDMDNLWVGPTPDGEAILGKLVTVSFEPNGAEGDMDDFEFIIGAGWTLPANDFYYSDEDLVFDGWNTQDDASGSFYDDQADADIFDEDITLYAVWSKALNIDNNATTNTAAIEAAADGDYNCKVTLTNRTLFKDGEWNTICLPFDISLEGSILDGAIAKTMDDAEMTGEHVDIFFSEPVDILQAGVPYIIKWNDGDDIVNPVFHNVQITAINPQTIISTDGSTKFIGYYDAFSIDASNSDIYYMTSGSMLSRTAKARTLKACRSYFQFITPSGTDVKALSFSIDFKDEATGIINIEAENQSNSKSNIFYDITGRPVSNPTNGIYIQNGKKIYIK